MPSQRQYRSIVVIVVILITFVVYVTRGPSMTHDSDFYKRTVSHMKEQSRHAASIQHAEEHAKRRINSDRMYVAEQQHAQEQDDNHGDQPPPAPMNDKLKARLREAEQLAKKSADDKYRALKDTEQEVEREKAERELKGKSIAGRKVVPAAAAQNDQQKLGTSREGQAQGHKHAEDPSLHALFAEIMSHSPITIFSKSYCPHSRKAKRILLHAFEITPKPYIVELDLHPHGDQLQALLNDMTGRRTVPNVMVGGKSLGGGDETESLWRSGDMATRLTQMAGKDIKKVSQTTKYGEDVSFKK